MITEIKPEVDRSVSRRFGTVADERRVKRTAAALEEHGITVLRAADAAEAKRIVLDLIPDGSQVHHGASQTLEVTGITDELENARAMIEEEARKATRAAQNPPKITPAAGAEPKAGPSAAPPAEPPTSGESSST